MSAFNQIALGLAVSAWILRTSDSFQWLSVVLSAHRDLLDVLTLARRVF